MARQPKHERGYSLIEVIIATAMLGLVMLAIMTLFFMGRRNIYSGQQMSRANAVAVRVLEDLSYMTGDELLENFEIVDSDYVTGCTCVEIKNTDSGAPAVANNWDSYVATSQMSKGSVTLRVVPVGGTAGSMFTTANFLRLTVTVRWSEELRARNVSLTVAKPRR